MNYCEHTHSLSILQCSGEVVCEGAHLYWWQMAVIVVVGVVAIVGISIEQIATRDVEREKKWHVWAVCASLLRARSTGYVCPFVRQNQYCDERLKWNAKWKCV